MANIGTKKWSTILVVGGAGRLGFYVIESLLSQPECGRIVSINRTSHPENQHQGVDYRAVDLCDAEAMRTLMHDVRPEIIINTAAPAHTNGLTSTVEFDKVLVQAQSTLIKLARDVRTQYLISTTSANVAAGHEHIMIDETAPLWPSDSIAFPYWVKRSEAERLLLAEDGRDLQTLSLRLPLIIGPRDYAFVPAMLKSLKDGATNVQIGDGINLLSTVGVGDAARAHTLALRALQQLENQVHGQAFYIVGQQPLNFWTMGRIIWTEAGWKDQDKRPWIMPASVAMPLATVMEWITYFYSWGTREPDLTRHVVRFMTNTWTYNGAKAERLLAYTPQERTEDNLRESVRFELDRKA